MPVLMAPILGAATVILIPSPNDSSNGPETDVMLVSDDDAQPKPKKMAKMAERPVAQNSQQKTKLPDIADRRDLATVKGPSTQKSNQIRKFLLLWCCGRVNWHHLETHIKHVPVSDDSDGNLTDIYEDPTPKKGRTNLIRSHAIGLIPDTRPAVKGNDDDYEPATEQEARSGNEEELEEPEDDMETPKKKKKDPKPKVRDLIEARREDLAISMAQDMEVSVTTSSELRTTSHFLFDQVCDVEHTTCVCCLSPRCLT
jgi:hypothetical protein